MYWPFLIGSATLAGFPLLSGFFSKDEIVYAAFASQAGSPVLGVIALVVVALTGFYAFQAFFLAFHGKSRAEEEMLHRLHTPGTSMVVPVLVLAFLAVAGGYLQTPWSAKLADGWQEPVFERYAQPIPMVQGAGSLKAPLTLISVSLGLLGILTAYFMYVAHPSSRSSRSIDDRVGFFLTTGVLFVLTGQIQERTGTRDMGRMGGLWATARRMGGAMLLFALASAGAAGAGPLRRRVPGAGGKLPGAYPCGSRSGGGHRLSGGVRLVHDPARLPRAKHGQPAATRPLGPRGHHRRGNGLRHRGARSLPAARPRHGRSGPEQPATVRGHRRGYRLARGRPGDPQRPSRPRLAPRERDGPTKGMRASETRGASGATDGRPRQAGVLLVGYLTEGRASSPTRGENRSARAKPAVSTSTMLAPEVQFP